MNEINDSTTSGQNVPMQDRTLSLKEVSRQLWALLRPLVVGTSVAGTFDNVERHNGLGAWRRLSLPIKEDDEIAQRPTTACN